MELFDTLIIFYAQLAKAGSKIKPNKWEANLDWKLEASRKSTKLSSLQEATKTFLRLSLN